MIVRLASLFATAILLAGCATLPQSATTRGLELDKVVDAIQCELARVYLTAPSSLTQELDKFISKAELELRVLNSVNASAEATIIVPISGSTGTFVPSAGADTSAGRTSNLKFFMAMKQLRTHECAKSDKVVPSTTFEQAPHNLGLTDWIIAALGATQRQDQAALDTMSYAIEFIVIPRAGGSLGLEVVNWSPKAKIGVEFKDTQTLNISFVRERGPDETLVRIVNWPSAVRGPSLMVPEGAAAAPRTEKSTPRRQKSDERRSQRRGRPVPMSPNTEHRLERELLQNRTQFGIQRAPVGF